MYTPCEAVVKTVLPNIRALIAKELSENYHMRQADVAKLLGISQSAVSMYVRKNRGIGINLEKERDVHERIIWLSERIFDGSITQEEYISKVCEICKLVRSRGLLCPLHKQYAKPLNLDACSYCLKK
jgi:predicted transcriptional regulator